VSTSLKNFAIGERNQEKGGGTEMKQMKRVRGKKKEHWGGKEFFPWKAERGRFKKLNGVQLKKHAEGR